MKRIFKLKPYDYQTTQRIAIHGDEWEYYDAWRVSERAMRSVKTGHIKWWPRHWVDNLEFYPSQDI